MQAAEPGAMPPDDDHVLRSQTNRRALSQIIPLVAGDLFYPMPGAAPQSLKVGSVEASRPPSSRPQSPVSKPTCTPRSLGFLMSGRRSGTNHAAEFRLT